MEWLDSEQVIEDTNDNAKVNRPVFISKALLVIMSK